MYAWKFNGIPLHTHLCGLLEGYDCQTIKEISSCTRCVALPARYGPCVLNPPPHNSTETHTHTHLHCVTHTHTHRRALSVMANNFDKFELSLKMLTSQNIDSDHQTISLSLTYIYRNVVVLRTSLKFAIYLYQGFSHHVDNKKHFISILPYAGAIGCGGRASIRRCKKHW